MGHCYVDIDSIGQLFIYFQSMVPQNNPGGGNEFPPSPWEILGHPNIHKYHSQNCVYRKHKHIVGFLLPLVHHIVIQ